MSRLAAIALGGLLAAALGPRVAAAQVDGHVALTPSALAGGVDDGDAFDPNAKAFEPSAVLSGPWRFEPSDDPAFADPALDDHAWARARTTLRGATLPERWSGRGWFRLRITVAPELQGRPLGLALYRVGDLEVFLDGVKILTFGQPDEALRTGEPTIDFRSVPHPIVFDRAEHVLAVRFVNPQTHKLHATSMLRAGFLVTIGEPATLARSIMESFERVLAPHRFFGGAAITFALLHFLFFFFHRDAKEHLWFALNTFAVAGIIHTSIAVQFSTSVREAMTAFMLFKLAIIATGVFGVVAVYAILLPRWPRFVWFYAATGVALAIASPFLSIVPIYVYVMIPLADELRVIVTALWSKRRGAGLIATGWLAFLVTGVLQMLPELGVDVRPVDNVYLYGFGCMLLAMSFHLGREFARTRRDLAAQLLQVKELSAIALERERKAKEDELARVALEADNQRKSHELEEAKKLAKALQDLEAANADIRQKQAQLVQSEKMASLGMLVAGVAHEINTPVGAISSVHDTLSRALERLRTTLADACPDAYASNPRIQSTLRVIEDANKVIESGSSRVAGIVKRLRSFARLDEAELKTVDIHEGIEDTLLLLHHELKHGVTVTKHFGELPPIACYPSQLNQVLLNLLVNAKQAMKGGHGHIDITTAIVDGKVHVRIQDDGSGIKPEVLPRIFDPGFTTKGVGVGTGLGLSICYQIMRSHRGEIRVESELGKGTTFTLVLPMDLDPDATMPP
ncbi:ATP-binding protein [Myxococcota bacterium]|nr:ATP-binding protein [Myxococcota bacterium]